MRIVNFPGTGRTPFEIVLARRGGRLTVSFLGLLTAPAARVLDEVLQRLAIDPGNQVVVDLSAARRPPRLPAALPTAGQAGSNARNRPRIPTQQGKTGKAIPVR